ncbi:hypothetical protein C3L33_08320, partial [Rhododendron williamsianum]
MAEAVFELLSIFTPNLREELNLLSGVREDIEYIKGEFERMTHFLRVADAIEDRDPQIKVWVKQVREAAYDTADALDMYMLRLRHHHSTGFREFVQDCLIDHWRLILLWVAEGFIEVKEGMTREEVAEGYLNELMNRSLVQVTEVRGDGRFKAYRIHDLWRELIIAKSREQNIVTIAIERGRAWPEKLRRLSVHHNLEDIQQSKGARLLTVLDLTGAQLETFPHEVVSLLNLTYLSLRATNVKMIPKSIGKLKKLETLDLKQTNVTELPDEILKLQHLRHLLLYRYNENQCYFPFHGTIGFKAPAGIGNLFYLQKLCAIEVNEGNNSGIVLREVGKLTQLRRLFILRLQKEDGTVLCSSLEKLNNLLSLAIAAKEEDENIDLDSLSLPPQLLRTLYLTGRLKWVRVESSSMPLLEELYLQDCKLMMELPSGVEHLANLRHLDLSDMSETLISRLNRDLQGGDYWKIAHVPKVWVGNSKSGDWIGGYL